MRAVIAVAVSVLLIGGCGGGSDDRSSGGSPAKRSDRLVDFTVQPPYVNALDVDPATGDFLLTTNRGFFRIDPEKGTVARVRGTVSAGGASAPVGTFLELLSTGPGQLLGSGHPDTKGALPGFLGLLSSADGGRSWRSVSRLGEADFHKLVALHDRLYGFDAVLSAMLISSDGGTKWVEHFTPPGLVIDFEVSPDDPDTIVAATPERLVRSTDGAKRWRPIGERRRDPARVAGRGRAVPGAGGRDRRAVARRRRDVDAGGGGAGRAVPVQGARAGGAGSGAERRHDRRHERRRGDLGNRVPALARRSGPRRREFIRVYIFRRHRDCYLSALRLRAPARATGALQCTTPRDRPGRLACTTRTTSTTPVASPWSRASTACPATRPSSARSSHWRTSSTVARRAPTPTRATARASCSSFPTTSCAPHIDDLPAKGRYGVAVCFLPQDDERRAELEQLLTDAVEAEGQRVVGWRDVPVDKDYVGITANYFAPYIKQLVVAAGTPETEADQDVFERKLYVIRRVAELAAGPDLVVPSFSSRTIVYKGMLTAPQLLGYYPDLQDERTATALALVHSRFSTNTFPSWELAHPYRYIAHNGEINTLRGNVNWMRARESQLASELFGEEDLAKLLPIVRPGGSDSATFDNVLELLVLAGRSLPHAVMMMIPEAFEDRDDLPEHLTGFYDFHSCLMEPWDGPAAVAFTDGRVIGATLDRNGLRPGRWLETKDGWVVLGSETGVMDEPASNIVRKGRLQPGKLFLVDLEEGRIIEDEEVKRDVATQQPYGDWYRDGVVHLADLPEARPAVPRTEPLRLRQLAFGYTQEDLRVLLGPTAASAAEPIGSMGNDFALAVLSDRQPPLFSYFKQLFAQVTNPPIDPIRESIVMSVASGVGSERNLFDETPEHARQLSMKTPILRSHELEKLRQVDSSIFEAHTLDITWPVGAGPDGLAAAIERVCAEASESIARGVNILILSDRNVGPERVPIPALLAVAGVHHHLVREGTRLQAGLVLESGEPREVHHFATLIGYGASAINPYLMFESLDELVDDGRLPEGMTADEAQDRCVKGIAKGLLKTISKMGISTIQSYTGAQIFEAVGLAPELIEQHFPGTASRIGGIGIDVLARETLDRHARAYPRAPRGPAPGRRHLRLAPRGRAPHVEPGVDRAAPARGPPRRRRDLRGVLEADERGRRPARHAARAAQVQAAAGGGVAASSTRSSRRSRSSSASPPARCRSARCRARRTRRWRSP